MPCVSACDELTLTRTSLTLSLQLVNVLDFSVSCAGVAVGRMGLSAAASVRAADLKEYSRRLGHVAVVAIVFRVLWVVDIIQQVCV